MKVFISWSGVKSKAVGDLLDEWLQCVIQAIDPWISTRYIDRGALWFTEITTQLNDTSIGIICLTKENINKPWILFEAGALAKGLNSNRVCTLLVDLDPSDIQDPLAQFNHTLPNKDGIFNLVMTLNTYLGEKALKEKVLTQVFDTYWPQFEDQFNKILVDNPKDEIEEVRTENDLLKELVSLTRNMDKRVRNLEYNNKGKYNKNSDSNPSSIRTVSLDEYITERIELGETKSEVVPLLIKNFGISEEMSERVYLRTLEKLTEKNI